MNIKLGTHVTNTHRRVHFTDAAEDGRIIGTGHTTEKAGTRTAELELIIDTTKLIYMLKERALLSQGRKVNIQSGAIVLRVVKGTESETHIPHVHGKRCYTNGELTCKVQV